MSDENKDRDIWDEPIPDDISGLLGNENNSQEPMPASSEIPVNSSFTPGQVSNPLFKMENFSNSPSVEATDASTVKLDYTVPNEEFEEVGSLGPLTGGKKNSQDSIPTFSDSSKSEKDDKPAIEGEDLQDDLSIKYTKPIKIKASIQSVYPHILILSLTLVVSFFPNILLSLYETDIAELPISLQEYLPSVLKYFFLILSTLVIVIIFKTLNRGTLQLFDGMMQYKKGLVHNKKIHYGNIQGIEVHRSLSSAWSETGNLIVFHRSGDFTIENVHKPFDIKEIILEKIQRNEKK